MSPLPLSRTHRLKQIIKESTPIRAKRIQEVQDRIAQELTARRVALADDSGGLASAMMLGMRLGRSAADLTADGAGANGRSKTPGSKTDVEKSKVCSRYVESSRSFNRCASLKEDLDELIASECPLCGDLMVKSIDRPFVAEDELDAIRSWQL